MHGLVEAPKGISIQSKGDLNIIGFWIGILRKLAATFSWGKYKRHHLQLTHPGNILHQQLNTFLSEVLTYLMTRFGNHWEKPFSLLRMFDPREMPWNLAASGCNEIHSLVQYFGHSLIEKGQESILCQWAMLHSRLSRRKATCIYKPTMMKT